jgi:hypothetical protein
MYGDVKCEQCSILDIQQYVMMMWLMFIINRWSLFVFRIVIVYELRYEQPLLQPQNYFTYKCITLLRISQVSNRSNEIYRREQARTGREAVKKKNNGAIYNYHEDLQSIELNWFEPKLSLIVRLKGRIAKKDGALTLDLFPDAYFMKHPSFLQQNASLRVVAGNH